MITYLKSQLLSDINETSSIPINLTYQQKIELQKITRPQLQEDFVQGLTLEDSLEEVL